MRQAGRYHSHYQKLKEKHDFMTLCKEPELAAEVALGPVSEFDFDVSILFSDLLFPLEALGMSLRYDPGPKFSKNLEKHELKNLRPISEAIGFLAFQADAVRITRELLPKHKSLIGFVGGPWTLYNYAVRGDHDGNLIEAKKDMSFYKALSEVLVPLLTRNIELQLNAGAEVVMIFDTSMGGVSPAFFRDHLLNDLVTICKAHSGRVGYYSKGTTLDHIECKGLSDAPWAGLGVDHRFDLSNLFKKRTTGFLQGNFDQALLFCEGARFDEELNRYLEPILELSVDERRGWVCGLGHGILPKTPEKNVHRFIETIRKRFS